MASVFCSFRVGGLLVGVEVERVHEVIRDPGITPVPLAHQSVAGLLNLRGQIITAVDARHRLGLPPRSPQACSAHVIVHCDAEAVSLIVDAEGDVVDAGVLPADDVPDHLSGEIRHLVTGIHQLDTELLLVLDADRTRSVTAQ